MVSIVCPFHNEKENLTELYQRLLHMTPSLNQDWELIFVNDGSSDGGEVVLDQLRSGNPKVRLLSLDRRYGLSTALYAGFEKAQGDFIASLDADLQNPPEEIPRLLAQLGDVDMVAGVRKKRRDGWLKRLSSVLARRIRQGITGDSMEDVGCSLRVFRKSALKAFLPYQGIHRFFLVFAEALGLRIKQISVAHEPRKSGRSKYGLANRLAGPLWDLLAVHWLLAHRIRYQIRGDAS